MTPSDNERPQAGAAQRVGIGRAIERVSWVLLLAYGVGLIVERTYDSLEQLPLAPTEPALALRTLVFGAVVVFFVGSIFLALAVGMARLRALRRRPGHRSRSEQHLELLRIDLSILPIMLPGLLLLTVVTPIFDSGAKRWPLWAPFSFGGFLVLTLLLFTVGLLLLWWRQRPVSQVARLLSLGLELGDHPTANRVLRVYVVGIVAVAVGLVVYPHASPAFGGGRGVPATVSFRKGTSSALASEHVIVLRVTTDFLVVTEEHSKRRRRAVRLIPIANVDELRLDPLFPRSDSAAGATAPEPKRSRDLDPFKDP